MCRVYRLLLYNYVIYSDNHLLSPFSHSHTLEERTSGKPRRPGLDELMERPHVKLWLAGMPAKSQRPKASYLHRFMAYRISKKLEDDPDKLVKEMENGTNATRIAHLNVLLSWAENKDGWQDLVWCDGQTLQQYYQTVRGFYLANHVDLPPARLKPRVNTEGTIEVPSEPSAREYLQMVKKVLDSGKLSVRDRSIVMTKVQSLLDNETLCEVFNYVAFPQLAKHFGGTDFHLWDENKVPVRIDLVRSKTAYVYYTFLHRDAISEMKNWLERRERLFGPIKTYAAKPKKFARSDPIYAVRYGGEMHPLRANYVSRVFRYSGERASINIVPDDDGVPKGHKAKRRYPFHAHEVRDTAISLARPVGVDMEVVNYFAGHNIDPLKYEKSPKDDPEWYESQYKKLARYLNLVSGETELLKADYDRKLQVKTDEVKREVEDLRAEKEAARVQREKDHDAVAKVLKELQEKGLISA